MRRLPKTFTAIALGGCSAPVVERPDSGFDAGYDAGATGSDAGTIGRPWGDAGCVLPSDFPWDAGFAAQFADSACQCVYSDLFHCFEEGGPRTCGWPCPPARDRDDGGYERTADGGLICLC